MSLFGTIYNGVSNVNAMAGMMGKVADVGQQISNHFEPQQPQYNEPTNQRPQREIENDDLTELEKKAREQSIFEGGLVSKGTVLTKLILSEILSVSLNEENIGFYVALTEESKKSGVSVVDILTQYYQEDPEKLQNYFNSGKELFGVQQKRHKLANKIQNLNTEVINKQLQEDLYEHYLEKYKDDFINNVVIVKTKTQIYLGYIFKLSAECCQEFAMEWIIDKIQKFKKNKADAASQNGLQQPARIAVKTVGDSRNEEHRQDNDSNGVGVIEMSDSGRQLELDSGRPHQERQELREVPVFGRHNPMRF